MLFYSKLVIMLKKTPDYHKIVKNTFFPKTTYVKEIFSKTIKVFCNNESYVKLIDHCWLLRDEWNDNIGYKSF